MERINSFVNIYKSCNNGNNKEKYDLIKCGKISLPRYIDVELTNFCNFRCCFCPTGTKSMQRVKGFMSDDVTEALISNIKRYNIPGVRFSRWGDYNHLLDIVKQLYQLRGDKPYPYIQISTTLTGETIEQISDFKHDIEGYCDYYNIGYTKLNHLNVDNMKIDED